MVRTEEFFAPKKSRKDRLKELAQSVTAKQAETLEPAEKPRKDSDSEAGAEEGAIPGLNIDRFVEQMAKEIDLDMAEAADGPPRDGLLAGSLDIQKQPAEAAAVMSEEEKVRSVDGSGVSSADRRRSARRRRKRR